MKAILLGLAVLIAIIIWVYLLGALCPLFAKDDENTHLNRFESGLIVVVILLFLLLVGLISYEIGSAILGNEIQ